MATVDLIPPFLSGFPSSNSSLSLICSISIIQWPERNWKRSGWRNHGLELSFGSCRAMVRQTVQGASMNYAKTMERLSAKESLLLACKDSGGLESLISGKTTDMHRIDVNERITDLERLNPTPRPTTSPFLEGQWNFEWLGAGSQGLFAARFLFERFPSTFAYLSGMDIVIKDGYAMTTTNMKLLNSIENKFVLTTRLSVEGPLRMKEEYVECIIETPTVREEAIPEQLKGVFNQAVDTLQQLPVLIRDAMANGLKLPLGGTFQRMFMISYLDEEILIIRDTNGAPDVLIRLDDPPLITEPITVYGS